jgi:D-alanyl-D-alanine dipeptidase
MPDMRPVALIGAGMLLTLPIAADPVEAAFPDAAHVKAARAYAGKRAGDVSFAVIDTSGRLTGLHVSKRYLSASTVKTMLLAAYLRRHARHGLNGGQRALLSPMIRRSDNDSASAVFGIVGNSGLRGVARAAGMTRFQPPARYGAWGGSRASAGDQARLFMHLDSVVPERHRAFARRLLSSVVRSQRWGIPKAARGRWQVFFKGGWRRGHGGRIVHQAARLEQGTTAVAMAVLTDGDPSHGYGTRTIRGVARTLLRGEPPQAVPAAGGLVRVGGDIALDMRYATSNNFTGRRLPGYCKPWALLKPQAARALERVQRRVARAGLGLKVYDAYRPARATRAMVRWARRTGNDHLLDGYIARRSNHNRGVAVDLTLVRGGEELEMGTGFDSFSTRSHTLNASGRALRNRLRLRRAMELEGFRNYRREWWHYDFAGLRPPPLDVGIGCGK